MIPRQMQAGEREAKKKKTMAHQSIRRADAARGATLAAYVAWATTPPPHTHFSVRLK